MATVAQRPEPALVYVFFLVASDTRGFRILELRSRVAFLAFHFEVAARKRKARSRVVEVGLLPVAFLVASRASRSLLALVHIVLGMAGIALGRKLDLACRLRMATLALRRAMFPSKWIARVLVVVEPRGLPVLRAMTALTLLAERTLVLIVLAMAGIAGLRSGLGRCRFMAVTAFDRTVLARQREARARMIELGFFPRPFDVAICARVAQRAFVRVVLAVTRHTSHRRVLERRALMAGLALHRGVLAKQRETGLPVVEARFLPAALRMTVCANAAESPLMLVILAMAGDALRRQLVLVQRAGMATVALDLAVPAAQGIAGIGVVIKHDGVPVFCVVTGLALLAEAGLVLVILAVTRNAGLRRLSKCGFLVAVAAFRGSVFSDQRKASLGVIESRFLPVLLRVTVCAGPSQRTLVGIVLAMAIYARAGRGSKFGSDLVAGAALHFRVLALQLEIGQRVVETSLVYRRDTRTPTFVLRVATAARWDLNATVVPLLACHVLRHLLVAIQAQSILSSLVQQDVAVAAFAFQFGVPFDHLPRHEHALERLTVRGTSANCQRCHEERRAEARRQGTNHECSGDPFA